MLNMPNIKMDIVLVALSWCFGVLLHTSHISAQDQPDSLAYFNGTSQATVNTQLNLQAGIIFSFRTCNGGEILSQTGASGDSIDFQVDPVTGAFRVQWTVAGVSDTLALGGDFNSNVWRLTQVEYKLGQLELTIGDNNTVLPSALLNIDLDGGDLLIVGSSFNGCVEEIQGLNLASAVDFVNVLWGECPLDSQVGCGAPIVDPCYSIPCQHGGLCTNLGESYTCECTARYNGSQCETDTGPLCGKDKYSKECQNRGFCREDSTGNYTFCQCPGEYEGELCERPANYCAPNPCQNGGVCHTNNANDGYTCECVLGWAGTNCDINIDDCASSPCRNNGLCIDGINNYTCNCDGTGYEGLHCDTPIDECQRDSPCQNGGTCRDISGGDGYFCICPDGYEGTDCETMIDECLSEPCQNAGTCMDEFNGYSCQCVLGFRGTNCEVNIDDCLGVICQPTYVCEDLVDGYQCVCPPGTVDPTGECVDFNECSSNPCVNGQCNNLDDRYTCSCDSGWEGINCDVEIDECTSDPCENNATCRDNFDSYTCECLSGFEGPRCEINIDDCSGADPCQNGGMCQDLVNDYECVCVPGYEGRHCEMEIDECEMAPCQNGATCTDLLNGFECECVPGFEGDRCEVDTDNCAVDPCQNGATCVDLVNDYRCDCTAEWMGRDCTEPYDPCVDLAPCQNNATCTSTPPSPDYNCVCVPGFEGDNCETNIDDCDGVVCTTPGEICYDLVDGFECDCPVGYEGANCATETDECARSPCVNGECIDNIGNYTCNCTLGFDGINCENDINECASGPCLNDAICRQNDPPPGYLCYCVPGFSGDNCDKNVQECDSDPCLNGATCVDDVNKFRCECAPGFRGTTCQIDIDECASDPCQNGATCEDMVNGYKCECSAGFNGTDCEIEINECDSMPCLNNGYCMDLINGYECNCTDTGFKGDSCEINIDDCDPLPCQNGALCSDKIKDYDCDCYLGYSGKDCEVDIDECGSVPCQNAGSCYELSDPVNYDDGFEYRHLFPEEFSYANASGYVCVCAAGFEGIECEVNIDECESGPCENGGTCEDLVNGYQCSCVSGWEGDHCELEINECDSSPCLNEATCRDEIDQYTCTCTSEYGGVNCEILLTACMDNTQCLNGASCIPFYDLDSGTHDFTCACSAGFIGRFCDVSTSASFQEGTYMYDSSTNGEVTLSYTLSFATTIPSGLLLYSGDLVDYILLEIFEGQLYFTYSDTTNGPLVIDQLGNLLADGEWHTVELDITNTDISLSVTGSSDTNDLSSSCVENKCTETVRMENGESVTLDGLFIGALDEIHRDKLDLTRSKQHYTGCMQDIANGGEAVLPPNLSGSGLGTMAVGDVTGGCERTEQCNPDPCSGNGDCTDLWWTYDCKCDLGSEGPNCNYSYISGTFSFEDTTSYALYEADTSLLPTDQNVIRFIFRTRERDGLIFYTSAAASYITIELVDGKLTARADFSLGMKQLEYEDNFANALYHTVTFERKAGQISLQVNKLAAKTTSFTDTEEPNFIYISVGGVSNFEGGIPGAILSGVAFKGCLTDVKYNDYSLQFFPLDIPGHDIPSIPIFTNEEVLEDCQSDDACRVAPCENGGTCVVTWNDFVCECPNGFGGKNCSELTICSYNPCPYGVECLDREDGGYDCITDATFNGADSLIRYHNSVNTSRTLDSISLRLRTREDFGILLHSNNEQSGREMFFTLEIFQGKPSFRFNLGGDYTLSMDRAINDGEWHDVEISVGSEETMGSVDMLYNATVVTTPQFPLETIITTEYSSDIYLANTDFTNDKYFRNYNGFDGCLDDVRIGELLLPFFNETTFNSTSEENFYATLTNVEIFCMGNPVCDSNPCLNGANCTDLWNEFECDCAPGFDGDTCENNIDECESSPCLMGSTCEDGINGYTCRCMPGYEGILCDVDIDECASNPCLNNATGCIDIVDGFECNCTANYTGRRCEFEVSKTCDDDPCKNGATCIPIVDAPPGTNAFMCECVPGYEGDNCAYEIDYCANHTCKNGATCNSSLDLLDYVCNCLPGYNGRFCEVDIDECDAVTCQNGGTCLDKIAEYECQCAPGYNGDLCEFDIDECASDPCENGGSCHDLVNGFICWCLYGYDGLLCQFDKDECESSPCQNGAFCQNTMGDFICHCAPESYGKLCDVTPCVPTPCLNSASCEASPPGVFTCNCSLGYQGPTCSVANCSAGVECSNGGSCSEDTDKTRWQCVCPRFYEGDFCQWAGPCLYTPCQNGATCDQQLIGEGEFQYVCMCPTGFNGTNCENEINWCDSNPCQQEGSNCTSDNYGFECQCAPGYGGVTCGNKLPDCASGLCLNGATCTDYDYSFECLCVPGYTGTQCQTDTNECASMPCQNGGECLDMVNQYMCNCVDTGYEGVNCENDINECASDPCANGGTCENEEGSFKCECVEGYKGSYCQAVDPCFFDKPCQNDGDCEPVYYNETAYFPKCTCKNGFEGTKCEQRGATVNWIIIGSIIGVVAALILIIIIISFIIVVKNKRATQGTYSPSRQEITGSRVEMDNVLKLPPEERLI